MKKISLLLITFFTCMMFATIAYGAGIRLDGKVQNNLNVNDVTSDSMLIINLSASEVKVLNEKITITLEAVNS